MTESQESANSWYQWLSGAVVAILIIAVLLLAFFFSRSSNNAPRPVEMTPISGGVAVPASLSGATDSDGEDAEEAESQSLAVGLKVTNISPEGSGTRLYNDAGINALVMESYLDGTAFVILEPSGDHDKYPVQSDEMNWYRVRTSDGLVGWVMAEQLVPIE